MIRTNDGISLDDFHEDVHETDHPLLETIALELTLIRLAIERMTEHDL